MTTLDKIRAEIESVEPKSHVQYGMRLADSTLMIPFHKVMQIIDKYAEQEPCDDAVSRQAVLDTEYQIKEINGIEYVMLSEVQMKIRKMPSVRPQEPKTGEWIALESRFELGDRLKCSECGQVFVVGDYVSRKYCPNCGAKMLQESEEV